MRRIALPAIPPVGGLRNAEIPPPTAHYTRKPHANPLRFSQRCGTPRRYPPFAVPVYASVGVNGGRCRMRRITLPAMPTVGARIIFATRRFPRPPPTPAMRVPCTPQGSHLWEFYVFSNDAARRVATVFETCNFLIETDLCARRENLPRKIEPLRAFRRGSPFGIWRFKSILPFLEGRSDAACRVVILPFAVPVDSHAVANDGAVWYTIPTPSPYQPKTSVASCSDFALKRNPNMKRRMSLVDTAQVRRRTVLCGLEEGEVHVALGVVLKIAQQQFEVLGGGVQVVVELGGIDEPAGGTLG